MFENYADLVKTTITDVAISAHLLHHRGRASVTHILAGLEQLRCRGLTSELTRLHYQAQAWFVRNEIAQPEPFLISCGLASVLAAPAEAVSAQFHLTPLTRSKLASTLPQLPVSSLKQLAATANLGREATRNAVQNLYKVGILHVEIMRSETFYLTKVYVEFIESFLPFALTEHRLPQFDNRPSRISNRMPNQDSPFNRIYDPFGYRINS